MIKSTSLFCGREILREFAENCERIKTPEGDWQGDGWGIAYEYEDRWHVLKSTRPIWEEKKFLEYLPESRFFILHARSASFQNQKNFIDYNQPFVSEPFSFVFNGFIKGVSIPFKTKGEIGSQRIWYIIQNLLKNNSPENSLAKLKNLILGNSKSVFALNVGLCDMENIYALCFFRENPEYYTLFYSKTPSLTLISSIAIIKNYDFKKLKSGEIVIL
ncbi:MAG: class II glutamine amidotransferase [Candidatus Aminicenantia bacterium]